jgi:hypothetical protein
MDDLKDKARTMALRGAQILDACLESGNWPATLREVDFTRDEGTPLALISPNSRITEGLEIVGITYHAAHENGLMRRGDFPPGLMNAVWRTIAAEREIEGART